jgi:hypothetical protein
MDLLRILYGLTARNDEERLLLKYANDPVEVVVNQVPEKKGEAAPQQQTQRTDRAEHNPEQRQVCDSSGAGTQALT